VICLPDLDAALEETLVAMEELPDIPDRTLSGTWLVEFVGIISYPLLGGWYD